MLTKEKLHEFSKKFVPEKSVQYKDFILNECDSFLEVRDICDKMERQSDEFQNLTKYHHIAMCDSTYYDFYQEAVNELGRG